MNALSPDVYTYVFEKGTGFCRYKYEAFEANFGRPGYQPEFSFIECQYTDAGPDRRL